MSAPTAEGASRARTLRRFSLAALAGTLYFAAFPPLGAHLVAFVALVPLLIALGADDDLVPRSTAFLLGWTCCAIAGVLLVGGSVYEAAVRYFGLSTTLAVGAGLLVPQIYGAPFFALFALAAREILARRRGAATTALAIAAAWTAAEVLRSKVGDGLPWLLLAHSQTAWPWLLQSADLAGAYGPTFVIALVNAAIAVAIVRLRRRRDRSRAAREIAGGDTTFRRGDLAALVATVAIVVGAAALYGSAQLARWRDAASAERARLRVALVQGNLPDAWRYSLAALPDALRRMTELTAQAARAEPDLIVWPENAISISVDANAGAFRSVAEALPPTARLLIGAPRAIATAPGRAALRNSAFLIDGAGTVLGTYDKQRLTPWAEIAPWPFSGSSGLGALRVRPASSDYSAGEAGEPLELGEHRFATLICSEAIYPELARGAAERGAEMIVVIGNDGWFGTRPAAAQHLDAVILRAIEVRRPILRATTTGITAAIDPTGAVIARLPQSSADVLIAEVHPIAPATRTVYARFGDAFGWLCVAAAITAALLPRATGRRGS